jgi:DNA polymerase-3 subunit epsilon
MNLDKLRDLALRFISLVTIERPVIFFDTETTGQDPSSARIVDLGFVMVRPDHSFKQWQSYVNPLCTIPHEATFGKPGAEEDGGYPGHGITNTKVEGCRLCGGPRGDHTTMLMDAAQSPDVHEFAPYPTFQDLAENLHRGFSNADFGGFNIYRYDLPLMAAAFTRAGHPWSYDKAFAIDGYRLWQKVQGRTLSDAVETFLGRKHEGAHGSIDDVVASLEVVMAQMERYPKVPRNLKDLHEWCWPRDPNAIDAKGVLVWRDGEVVFTNKKWNGTKLKMMTRRDLKWIAEESTGFSQDVKKVCGEALKGNFPVKETA